MTPANHDLAALRALVWADLPSRQFDYVHQVQRGAAAVGPQTLVLPGWPGCTCHILGDDPLLSSAATLSWNWNPCLKVCGAPSLRYYTLNEDCLPTYINPILHLLASYVTLRELYSYYHFIHWPPSRNVLL